MPLTKNASVTNPLLTLASAVLLPYSQPNQLLPDGATLPGLVALAPLFLMLHRSPSRRTASKYGIVFGVVSTIIGNYWLAFFGAFSLWTVGGVVLVYAVYNYLLFGVLFVFVTETSWSSAAFRPL